MSRKKLVAYRLPEGLIQMIKDTAMIMDRSESDTVRILLWRACRYWITKKETQTPVKEIRKVINELSDDADDDIEALLASIAHLK
jgi:hypothetical protein